MEGESIKDKDKGEIKSVSGVGNRPSTLNWETAH
jgi:hypothetical protein